MDVGQAIAEVPEPAIWPSAPVITHPVAYVTAAEARPRSARPRGTRPAHDPAAPGTVAVRVGDRFEEVGPSRRQLEVVSIIRPASGILHARLRDIARPRARHFVSLRALLDATSYRPVSYAAMPIAVKPVAIALAAAPTGALPLQTGGFIPERCAACPVM